MVTLLYKRQNIIEEVIADLFGVSQGTVSYIITEFTSLIAQATEEFRPDAEEAKQMTRGRLALVDGTLWPCWSQGVPQSRLPRSGVIGRQTVFWGPQWLAPGSEAAMTAFRSLQVIARAGVPGPGTAALLYGL
jgi:hypothetical protein